MNEPTSSTPFSSVIGQRVRGDAEVGFVIPDDWLQGRTSFGGLVAALGVQAMRDAVASSWPAAVTLRALQTNFIAPVGPALLAFEVQLLREGRHVRQVQAVARQADETVALLVGVFGSDRETVLAPLRPLRPAPVRSVDELAPIPYVPGVRPDFMRHFDTRWAEGGRPYSGSRNWNASIHLRPADTDAARWPAELATVMLADVSPSPAISHFDRPTPSSSVSWALEFGAMPPGEDIAGWWRADTEVVAADRGYVNQRCALWAPGGTLAALAYQVVTVYG